MNVLDCLDGARAAGPGFQGAINSFVDGFRRATPGGRAALIARGPSEPGPLEGLLAAVVSALCRETGTEVPSWAATLGSPEPFFAFPAKSFELSDRAFSSAECREGVRAFFAKETPRFGAPEFKGD